MFRSNFQKIVDLWNKKEHNGRLIYKTRYDGTSMIGVMAN